MMEYLTAEARYNRDPLFHHLVDQMHYCIETLKLTPTELREAAMLASIMFDMRHPRPLVFRNTGPAASIALEDTGPLRRYPDTIAKGRDE